MAQVSPLCGPDDALGEQRPRFLRLGSVQVHVVRVAEGRALCARVTGD